MTKTAEHGSFFGIPLTERAVHARKSLVALALIGAGVLGVANMDTSPDQPEKTFVLEVPAGGSMDQAVLDVLPKLRADGCDVDASDVEHATKMNYNSLANNWNSVKPGELPVTVAAEAPFDC